MLKSFCHKDLHFFKILIRFTESEPKKKIIAKKIFLTEPLKKIWSPPPKYFYFDGKKKFNRKKKKIKLTPL